MLDKKKQELIYTKNNVVFTKTKAKIILDLTEYKNIKEELSSPEKQEDSIEFGIEQVNGAYETPGFIKVIFPDEQDEIQFFFPYNIYVLKTEDMTEKSDYIEINYESNDGLFYANFKKTDVDLKVVDRLFENRVKYYNQHPDKQCEALWKQLDIPLHHIETILSGMYGTQEKGKFIYTRLSSLPHDQKYSKSTALSTKQAAHYFNTSLGALYGYANDFLLHSITTDKSNLDKSYLEKVMSGDYSDEFSNEELKKENPEDSTKFKLNFNKKDKK